MEGCILVDVCPSPGIHKYVDPFTLVVALKKLTWDGAAQPCVAPAMKKRWEKERRRNGWTAVKVSAHQNYWKQ